MIYSLWDLLKLAQEVHAYIDGKYVPARPLPGFLKTRIKASWLVLIGKADAVVWPLGQ